MADRLYDERKAAGLCPRCGGERDVPEKLRCSACSSKDTEQALARYYQRQEAGLCPSCGGERDREDTVTCSSCIIKASTRNKRRRGTLRPAGTVVVVPSKPTKPQAGVPESVVPLKAVVLSKQPEPAEETLRSRVLDAYGGQCACCGLKDRVVLALDHIDGGGNKHRKALGVKGGKGFYRWVIAHDFPPFLQLLCANCHVRKTRFGRCSCAEGQERRLYDLPVPRVMDRVPAQAVVLLDEAIRDPLQMCFDPLQQLFS